MIMLSTDPAAAADSASCTAVTVNGATSAVNGPAAESEARCHDVTSNGNGCFTPVTDPDSLALLAAMHEANRCL